VEIKPTKLVKGQGLAKLLADSNCRFLDLNTLSTNIIEEYSKGDETQEPSLEVNYEFSKYDWYKDILFYLQNSSYSPTWDKANSRYVILKTVKYFILGEICFGRTQEESY